MKTILLAVDSSSNAKEAARFVSRLPHKTTIEVTVLTVVQAPYVNTSCARDKWIQEAYEADRTAAIDVYQEIEQMFLGANAIVRHEMREGHVAETIVEAATERATELVVLGAKGRSNVSRILLGSTSDYVATHAPCSVLVVRPDTSNARSPLKIALGYEETGPAQAALEELTDVGWGDGAEIHLLTISPSMYGFFGEFESNPESVARSANTLQNVSDQLRGLHLNANPHLIQNEHVGESLVQFTKDNHCQLVIVGETPRGRLGQMLMGSTSRHVLRHSDCSVWITRNRFLRGLNKSKRLAEEVS